MRFGKVAVDEAEGAVLAHAVPVPGGKLKKGRVLSGADLAALRAAGLADVIVARLDPCDVPEDAAAAKLAAALVPDPAAAGLRLEAPFTGRVNIRATGAGVVALDVGAIARLNDIDPMITLATVPEWQRVEAGMMVGTVKIIAYAVPETALAAACAVGAGAMRRQPPLLASADLIVTETAPGAAAEEDKGVRAVWARVARLGLAQGSTRIVPHEMGAVAQAIAGSTAEMVLILTGSATSDIADVVPAGLVAAGGAVIRFGMPVDPGNLLVLGRIGTRPVIGLPGCARSPALNGADWVLERVACGVAVTGADIAAMGVGGLLKEIPTRPQPRERRLTPP
ncbi:molybdopterin-binding protein [Roseicyclus mahoneyensis]|uniref:Molybdenum cofactor cytidylyltransferase n=1 Tax=Roseicyclus mahoneyensis TaxID=164332 RepID=A0A316GR28_9RHOB|nr:molybdopterin-binding protein [Roseicyclus mahoneyensis]PWK62861.1 molybdenum cofactor cytidylyltransferase [Roseicyclus mahoneyensis]